MINQSKRKRHPFRWLWYIILPLTAAAVLTVVSHQWVVPDDDEFDHLVTIMTYNTHCIGWKAKQERQRMMNFILAQNADIVCLEEVNIYKTPNLMTLFELRHAMKRYDYTYYDFKIWGGKTQFGNVVFSRYPLIHKHTIPYDSRSNISSRCDVVVGDDTLRLVVNHLESYRFNSADRSRDSLLTQPVLRRKLEEGNHRRHDQARIVKEDLNQSPYPLVVVGDLNSIPLSWVYWHIRGCMRDCFLEGSRGSMGSTFVKHGVGLRIDYVLTDRCLTPVRCTTPHSSCSDHYPVVATIGF